MFGTSSLFCNGRKSASRLAPLATIAVTYALLMGCNKNTDAVIVAAKPAMHTAPPTFMPPHDGRLALESAKHYAEARSKLAEVTSHLVDSLVAAPEDRKPVFRRALDMACETVARHHNLYGAAEYRWIQTEATRAPENREVLAEAGIQTTESE